MTTIIQILACLALAPFAAAGALLLAVLGCAVLGWVDDRGEVKRVKADRVRGYH